MRSCSVAILADDLDIPRPRKVLNSQSSVRWSGRQGMAGHQFASNAAMAQHLLPGSPRHQPEAEAASVNPPRGYGLFRLRQVSDEKIFGARTNPVRTRNLPRMGPKRIPNRPGTNLERPRTYPEGTPTESRTEPEQIPNGPRTDLDLLNLLQLDLTT